MKSLYTKTLIAAAIFTSISSVNASSHREAPFITELPKVDATDFYMFNSYEPGREGFVTLIANYLPLQDSYGGPNYFSLDPDAMYEIHISNDDDAEEEITFQFDFSNRQQNISLNVAGKDVAIPLKNAGQIGPGANDNSALNERESYTVNVIYGDRRDGESYPIKSVESGQRRFMKPVDNIGTKSIPNYEDYANDHIYDVNIPNCGHGKVFVGQRQEGFAVNLGGIFDLVNFVPVDGTVFPGGIEQSKTNNILDDKNITTLALEVPASCLTKGSNKSIGGWTTASLKQARVLNNRTVGSSRRGNNPERYTGSWVQVSRLGNPLVNEVVIGLKDKDLFNRSEPKDDAQFADYVTNPTLPALLNILFKDAINSTLGTSIPDLAPTNFPRLDLVTAFLTGFDGVNKVSGVSEVLRLNTAIPAAGITRQNSLGVAVGDLAGYPNGRRPGDDTVDIALRAVMGVLCHDLPLGIEGEGVNLNLCGADAYASRAAAAVGNVPFTDGAPMTAYDFENYFPYLNTPIPGAGE